MKYIKTFGILLFVFWMNQSFSQCETFDDISHNSEIEDAYSIFRSYFKQGDFEKALPYWKEVYANAPALNGRINFVYSNGRELYYLKFQTESNLVQKKEFAKFVLKLYEEEKVCFPNRKSEALPKDIIEYLESKL